MSRALLGLTLVAASLVIGVWLAVWDGAYRSPVPGARAPASSQALTYHTETLYDTFSQAPWTSPKAAPGEGGSATLWVVATRDCVQCGVILRRFAQDAEQGRLDLRVIYTPTQAPGAPQGAGVQAEHATLAQLALSRSWDVLSAWTEPEDARRYYARVSHPPVSGDGPRQSALAQLEHTRLSLTAITVAHGWDLADPAFFWREGDGQWRIHMGSTARVERQLRRALGLPRSSS